MPTSLEPVPQLLTRLRAELSASFVPGRPTRIARAPGRLDVMGGVAEHTGSLVCHCPLARATALALQGRDDRQVQVFSFNRFDEHQPFTLIVPLDVLANAGIDQLRAELSDPGRAWAGHLVGALTILHDEGLIDLTHASVSGFNVALLNDVPARAGLASGAASEVAMMSALIDELGLRARVTPTKLAALCQRVQAEIVGRRAAISGHVAACVGEAGRLTRIQTQPGVQHASLALPDGIRVMGIDSGDRRPLDDSALVRSRCAAFMGRRIILEKMRQMGRAAGRELVADPMNGHLANLALDDYKRFFRPFVPEQLKGGQFLLQYGGTIDKSCGVEPDFNYAVQHATDHHVFEASRVRNFIRFIEDASSADARDPQRKTLLDKAGHLMYASHVSYTEDAMLGSVSCDVLVEMVRKREHEGLYGARITAAGQGGTVAVLCDTSSRADRALADICQAYREQTGLAATTLAPAPADGGDAGPEDPS